MRPSLHLALLPTLTAALFAIVAAAHAAEQARSLPSFIAINGKGAFSLVVEAGKTQSVRVSGEDQFIASVKTEVIDNELVITMQDKSYQPKKGDPRVTITMPALSRLKIEGAGETVLSNIAGDRLDISYQGAGRLQASGAVKYLRLSARGVGQVNTKALIADRIDVNFEGIGSVSVYARDLLNAVVRGMGTLEYYGHPRTVNKSAEGIGSVKPGD